MQSSASPRKTDARKSCERKRERKREAEGRKQKERESPRAIKSRKREKGATKNKKSGSPLRSERLGAGGLEQVITSGCGGDAACAGPS